MRIIIAIAVMVKFGVGLAIIKEVIAGVFDLHH
jgi:hypothetical protein